MCIDIDINNYSLHFSFLDYSLEDYKNCVQAGIKAGANIYGVYVSVSAEGGSCDGLLNEMGGKVAQWIKMSQSLQNCHCLAHDKRPELSFCIFQEDTKVGSMMEDFVAVVKGGSSETITALLSKKLPTPELMRLWGEGVRFNPDFIRITVRNLV